MANIRLTGDADDEEERINLGDEEDPGVTLFLCFHCEKFQKSLLHLKEHIKSNHSELYARHSSSSESEFSEDEAHIREINSPQFSEEDISQSALSEIQIPSPLSNTTHEESEKRRRPFKKRKKYRRNVAKFLCYHCQKSYKGLKCLKTHIQNKHLMLYRKDSSRKKRSKRKKKKKKSDSKKRTKKPPKELSCPHCDFSTFKPNTLTSHIKFKHSKERPHKCPHCDYSTVTSGTLKRHIMYKHTGEKPYNCEDCSFSTPSFHNLRLHVLSKHCGGREKVHSCPMCYHTAATNSLLKLHILYKHSPNEPKPNACDYCPYTTIQSSNLYRHIASFHANEKRYSCMHCSYKTVSGSDLRRHSRRSHPEMNSSSEESE